MLNVVFIFVLTLMSAETRFSNGHRRDLGLNITKILNAFFDHGYDKRVRPNYGGPPVEVQVSMYIVSISSVSEVLMDFTSDFYFRQAWKDSRLSFEARPGIESLSVGAEVAERIWVPDTFFANEKSAYFHLATTPNTFLRIGHGGEVYRSMRLTVTASCPMELQYFPMDRQTCSIEVESYGYSMADIRYKWMNDKAVGIDDNVMLPQFSILGYKQMDRHVVLSTGNYSRLICEIQLVRSMGYYMIQIYIPASLIVIISWVSFWLHRNATPARVQLGVLTVLTMTTLMSSTNSQLPKISYVKSIDVFLGTCFVMVFAALLEYAAVGYIGKRISMRKNRYHQLAKAADDKKRRLLQIEATTGMKYRSCDDLDSPQLAPPADYALQQPLPAMPMPQTPAAHYATIRRHLGDCQRQVPPPGQQAHQPSGRSLGQIIYGHSRPQDVRLDMIGSKTTASVTQSPSTGDLDGLASPNSPPYATGNGNGGSTGVSRNNSLRHRNPASAPPSTCRSHTLLPMPTAPAHNGQVAPSRNLNELFGVSPSDIDKYSRVVFPVCFVCFNLMYWMIYLHISNVLNADMLESPQ